MPYGEQESYYNTFMYTDIIELRQIQTSEIHYKKKERKKN